MKQQKRIAELVLFLPLIVYIVLVGFKFVAWKSVLVQTGFIACGLLLFLLSLNPLRRVVPHVSLIAFVNRFRRQIGVAVFFYALLHYIAVIMKSIIKKGHFWPSDLLHPVLMTGFIAFLLLFLLAITSNNYSVRTLGGRRWKQLHHWTYVAEALIFVHLLLQGGNSILIGCLMFIPIIALQIYSRR